MEETWKDVNGFEGHYQVSDFGSVRSVKNGNTVNLKTPPTTAGYPTLRLCKDGKAKTFYVHRLVACAFLKRHPDNNFINHIDGDKSNNSVYNLEWVSNRENMTHSFFGKNKSSKYYGVGYSKENKNWVGRFYHDSKNIYVGTFNCETSAYFATLTKLKSLGIINKYS